MPLAPKADLKEYANIVGETEFAIPDSDDVEMVKLHIYYAAPIFIDDKLNDSFGTAGPDGSSLVDQIKSHVKGLERGVLISTVQSNGGAFTFTVGEAEVTLQEGTHFWSCIRAQRAAATQ